MDDNVNLQILSALNAVSCRLSAIEQRIDRTEEQLQGYVKPSSDVASSLNVSTIPSQDVRIVRLGTPPSFPQQNSSKHPNIYKMQ